VPAIRNLIAAFGLPQLGPTPILAAAVENVERSEEDAGTPANVADTANVKDSEESKK
jgi:hypothetical protein